MAINQRRENNFGLSPLRERKGGGDPRRIPEPDGFTIQNCEAPQTAEPGDTILLTVEVDSDSEFSLTVNATWTIGGATFSTQELVPGGITVVETAVNLHDQNLSNIGGEGTHDVSVTTEQTSTISCGSLTIESPTQPPTGGCSSDAGCPSGEVCQNGQCVQVDDGNGGQPPTNGDGDVVAGLSQRQLLIGLGAAGLTLGGASLLL